MSFPEVERQIWLKTGYNIEDKVTVPLPITEWQAPRVALLALRRQTVFAVSMEQTEGQKWAPLATLEWLDSSLVRCVCIQCREWW